jgi:hypothetical protein
MTASAPHYDGQDEGAVYSEQQLPKSARVNQRGYATHQSGDHGRIVPAL